MQKFKMDDAFIICKFWKFNKRALQSFLPNTQGGLVYCYRYGHDAAVDVGLETERFTTSLTQPILFI
jgi:hypothetical protein